MAFIHSTIVPVLVENSSHRPLRALDCKLSNDTCFPIARETRARLYRERERERGREGEILIRHYSRFTGARLLRSSSFLRATGGPLRSSLAHVALLESFFFLFSFFSKRQIGPRAGNNRSTWYGPAT